MPSVSFKKGTNNYFRVTVRHQASNNIVAGLRVTLKIYAGSGYSLYNLTTDDGVVFSNHNVTVSVYNRNYNKTFNCTTDSNGRLSWTCLLCLLENILLSATALH